MILRDIPQPWLGVMATGELAERETHYPKRVKDGRMTQEEAETRLRIWRALATLFSQRSAVTGLSWGELEHELAHSLARLNERVEAKPGDEIILQRREATEAMLSRIRWHRERAMAPQPKSAPAFAGEGDRAQRGGGASSGSMAA